MSVNDRGGHEDAIYTDSDKVRGRQKTDGVASWAQRGIHATHNHGVGHPNPIATLSSDHPRPSTIASFSLSHQHYRGVCGRDSGIGIEILKPLVDKIDG